MNIETTPISDLVVLTPRSFEDDRGYFFESFSDANFEKLGLKVNFIQDNQSFSKKGVIRGLHFQKAPFAQSKLFRVLQGEVLDVAVDLREDSKTFGHYYSIILNAENKKQLFVPKGFAHGFSVLSATAMVAYKVDEVYNKESESGILYNDTDLNIDWKIAANDVIVSDKDELLPSFKQFNM